MQSPPRSGYENMSILFFCTFNIRSSFRVHNHSLFPVFHFCLLIVSISAPNTAITVQDKAKREG